MSEDILFNILVRTSNRPNYFNDCIESIRTQTYVNHKIIVSVDNSFSDKYVKKLNLKPVFIKTHVKKIKFNGYAPYDLYINELYKFIDDGYIIILDDDDQFENSDALESLSERINSYNEPKDNLYIYKTKFTKNLTIPRNFSDNKIIYPGNITSCCFCFHSKWIFAAQWDEIRESDFRVVNKLNLVTNKTILIDKVFTKLQSPNITGGLGKQVDKI